MVCVLALASFPSAAGSQAARFKITYSFCAQASCADGAYPAAGLMADAAGNLYGSTEQGGPSAAGTLFMLTSGGSETVLYTFCSQPKCSDGYIPAAPPVMDSSGNLYGTTTVGGNSSGCNCGVVFKIATDDSYSVLHAFSGGNDGFTPSGLIIDSAGNLYGTTVAGGASEGGTVFRIAADGTFAVLYSFCSKSQCRDGKQPESNLIIDRHGNLYGTTALGGNSSSKGTIFRLRPTGAETVLYEFCSLTNCSDGAVPASGLTMDKKGNLFGTTVDGGGTGCDGEGCGTVFELAPDGTETVLHAFSGTDGALPYADLVKDKTGNLYGTTAFGANMGCNEPFGCGTVFKLAPSGALTMLHSFCTRPKCSDGAESYDYGGMFMNRRGQLFGTAALDGEYGGGEVFEVK